MSTSGAYTFSVNRDQIVRLAMLNIGQLQDVEAPTPQEISDCALFLNMLVKQWMGKADFAPGLKTWTRRHGHLFLSGATGQYTVGPGATGWTNSYLQTTLTAAAAGGQPVVAVTSVTGVTAGDKIGVQLASGTLFWTTILSIASLNVTMAANLPSAAASGAFVFTYTTTAQQPDVIETAVLRDGAMNDTPLRMITLQEYDFLPSKANPLFISDPSAIYHEFQLGNSTIFIDCAGAQDVTKHIAMTYMEATQDFVSATDTPSYPQEWYLPLAWGLGKQIAPMFNAPWTQNMEDNYKMALAIAQKKEPERSALFFQPGEDG
ncbi:MAG: hypothetical protein JWR07_1904 [Nevskia sp.]|nr:hypothetical protein [Nevskia sp.]